MSSEKCPECGSILNGNVCDSCGYTKISRLILKGSSGSICLGITTKIGKHLLSGLLGDEARFYGTFQFELGISHSDAGWVLISQGDTANNTLLNGSVCDPGVRYLIKPGDVIALGSKSGSGKVCGEITVQFES